MERKLTILWFFLMSSSILKILLSYNFSLSLQKFFSSTSFSYKLGLLRMLKDRAYKINNTLLGFNEEAKKLTYIFKKN